jgi:hypothetical protein
MVSRYSQNVLSVKKRPTLSDELEEELDVESAGAVHVPRHQHTQTFLQIKQNGKRNQDHKFSKKKKPPFFRTLSFKYNS